MTLKSPSQITPQINLQKKFDRQKYAAALTYLGINPATYFSSAKDASEKEQPRNDENRTDITDIDNYLTDNCFTIALDGSLVNEAPGHLGAQLIIMSPEQFTLASPTSSTSPTLTNPLKSYSSSLSSFALRHFECHPNRALLEKIIEQEPLIASLQLMTLEGKPFDEFNQYLRAMAQQEFPHLYSLSQWPSAEKKIRNLSVEKAAESSHLSLPLLPPKIRPYLTYETPTGTIAKVISVHQRQQQLIKEPFTYLLDTAFMQGLHQDIQNLQQQLGSIPKPLALHQDFGKVPYLPVPWAIEIQINQEKIYILGNSDSTMVISVYSTIEQEKKYHQETSQNKHDDSLGANPQLQQLPISSIYTLNLQEKNQEVIQEIIQNLFSFGFINLDRAYGEQRLQEIERDSIRRRGFQLFEQGADFEKAQRYIKLQVSRIEKYSLLAELVEQNELANITGRQWNNLHEVIRGKRSLRELPGDELMYFIKEGHEHQTITALLDQINLTSDHQQPWVNFESLDACTQKTKIAKYLELHQPHQTKNSSCIEDCAQLIGSHYISLIHEVAAVVLSREEPHVFPI